jgi:hypothetical protein
VTIPIQIRAYAPAGFPRRREPATLGVPLPKGMAADASGWRVADAGGQLIPHQAHVLDRWSDGSVRWALVDLQVSLPAGATTSAAQLSFGPGSGGAAAYAPIQVARQPRGLSIETGAMACVLSVEAPLVLAQIRRGTLVAGDAGSIDLSIVSAAGAPFVVRWQSVDTEMEGPVRTVVVAHGQASSATGEVLDLVLRYDFFCESPVVRMRLTVRNPRPARHPGGIWELGDAGSVYLKECTVRVRMPEASSSQQILWSVEPAAAAKPASDRVRIYQESSGGERWSSSNHRNRRGVTPMTFRGYRVDVDGVVETDLRATPAVATTRSDGGIGVAIPEFWQNFPRALGATTSGVEVSFWPPEFPDDHELQGGEQKTHEAYLMFGQDAAGQALPDWCRERLVCHLEPAWYAESQAVPYVTPAADDPNAAYQALVDAAIEGPDTFEHKRERLDEYGWRHFGDIYGDHEAVFAKTAEPLVSHYNNQYDPVGGFAYQFMRTGDLRWWRQCVELASHVIDIDIYHTDQDKAAYNHGLFWHTVHYVDAGLAAHRTYPKGTIGGGPSSEQNYSSGLMLHYFMTGDTAARETAIGLAQFVIDMDDGNKTVFRWLDRGDTGVATASAGLAYQGPGRGPGNSLNALLDGYRLTNDLRFLQKAEQIIRRCVHPREDLSKLDLLDAERKWFYTMFLQSLGKYLDVKIERGELDGMYRYGQHALLHYARWMAEHEYPYLEKPEILEYPTETWPAQDMRKSEVFNYASRHAAGAERATFVERARYFFHYATTTLASMPTRTLARPVVLLLSFGFTRAYFDSHPDAAAPPSEAWHEPDDRQPFVPQRVRARKRAILVAAAGASVTVVAIGWLALRWLS